MRKILKKIEKKVAKSIEITNKDLEEEKVSSFLYFPFKNKEEVIIKEGDKVKVGDLLISTSWRKYFSPCSGKFEKIEKLFSLKEKKHLDYIVIENDFKYEESKSKYKEINLDSSREDMLKRIEDFGIVGMGGGLYPLHLKYRAQKIDKVIFNAIECEPFYFKDKKILKENKQEIKIAISMLEKMSLANFIYFVFKRKEKKIYKEYKEVFKENKKVIVKKLRGSYPLGWERVIIRKLLKKEYDLYPSEINIAVNNIETLLNMEKAFKGEKITRRNIRIFQEETGKYFSLEVLNGTRLDLVLEFLKIDQNKDYLLLLHGPFTSSYLKDIKTPIDESISNIMILKKLSTRIKEECLRCGKCILKCPSGLNPIEINEAFLNNDISYLKKSNISKCCECGVCSFVCPSNIENSENIIKAKKYLEILNKRGSK